MSIEKKPQQVRRLERKWCPDAAAPCKAQVCMFFNDQDNECYKVTQAKAMDSISGSLNVIHSELSETDSTMCGLDMTLRSIADAIKYRL